MFIAGAINVHLLRHHYSDENIEDKSLRQFQNRFKISREERTADKEAVVNVHYLKKNDHDIVVKSSQPQAVVVGDGDEVLPQDSRKKEHITDHSISINKSAKPQILVENIINMTAKTKPFVRHDRVVIATKIHGEHQIGLLKQSMCLLHHAYNHKVLYDIITFSTNPITQESLKSLQAIVAPARFSLVVDNMGLQEEYDALSNSKKTAFLKMCNVTSPGNLTWWTDCDQSRLAYNWQAEFRGLRIWNHTSLANYKTMLWLDSDGFATKPWEKDPVDYFVRNRGAIMFDHFPLGTTRMFIQKSMRAGFNSYLCSLKLSNVTGNLVPELDVRRSCQSRRVPLIHGFFHITDLDFYRSKPAQVGLEAIFADGFLRRSPCDQLAVTAPAAMLAPDRSFEMRARGFHLDVYHNYAIDGIDKAVPGGFINYWKEKGQKQFPSAFRVCKITEGG